MKGIVTPKSLDFQYFIIILLLVFITACEGIPPSSPIINSFTADSTTIDEGDSVTLSWSVTDASTVTINPGGLTVALSGSTSVSPTTTTTYNLTATNSAGSSSSTITITVNEEPVALFDGTFNTCDFSGWTVTTAGTFPQIYHTDDCVAYMGDGNGGLYNGDTNTASIQQTVNIPTSAVNPRLSFYYKVNGTDGDGEGFDWMRVYINGTEILYVWSDTGGWQHFENYDLSAYIGSSFVLKVSAWTDDDVDAVHYYVDNFSITWDEAL